MSFSVIETTRDGATLDILTDEVHGLRLEVSRAGAEIISLTRRAGDGEWVAFLYRDGDVRPAPEGWSSHATVMGYFLHRLLNQRSIYRGEELRGGTHSFIRTKIFQAPEVSTEGSGKLIYRLSPDKISRHEYPLQVALTLTYELRDGAVWVTFAFENREPELTAHVSFGLHPGFAATSLKSAEVLMPAGKYLRHIAPGNFLSGEKVEIDHPGGPMPFTKEELPGSVLLEMKSVEAPIFVFADPESRRQVYLNFAGAPYVTIWSDGHAFICVEPCWGLPDHHEQRPFEEKEGIQEIAAGETLTRTFSITPYLP